MYYNNSRVDYFSEKPVSEFERNLINLTENEICAYDCTGGIVSIPSRVDVRLPKKPQPKTAMYIIPKELYRAVVAAGRGTEDLAYASYGGLGRDKQGIWWIKAYKTNNRLYPATPHPIFA